jgi:hypothetical protein
MLSCSARRAPQITMRTTSCTTQCTHRMRPPRGGCWAEPSRAAQRQLLILLLNGGCCCSYSTVAVAAAAGPGRAAQRQLLLLLLLLLLLNGGCSCYYCSVAAAGPGRAGPGRAVLVNQSNISRLRRRAVRGATGGAHICGARRALPESILSSAAHHTCCNCALLAGAAGRARCADTAHDPQRTPRAVATAPLACSAGSVLRFRRWVYPARGARYKCTIGFLQRMVVSALHAPPAATAPR